LQGLLAHFGAPGARRGVRGAPPARPSRLVSDTSSSLDGGLPVLGVWFGGLKSIRFGLVTRRAPWTMGHGTWYIMSHGTSLISHIAYQSHPPLACALSVLRPSFLVGSLVPVPPRLVSRSRFSFNLLASFSFFVFLSCWLLDMHHIHISPSRVPRPGRTWDMDMMAGGRWRVAWYM
jgi:hypothetical protein